jgi:hypothetical protein
MQPEAQMNLYKAVRDGNIATVTDLLPVANINDRPFEALWHDPGAEATCLHLAVCCVQPDLVAWLLAHGADPHLTAGGHSTLAMLDAFDLFAPARLQRPADVAKVRAMLT